MRSREILHREAFSRIRRIISAMKSPELLLVRQTHSYDEDVFRGYTSNIAALMDTPPFDALSDVVMQTDVFAHQWQLGVDALYCIVDSSGRFYGQASLMDLQSGYPEIGIWVAEEHQGKGVGKEALRLLLEEAQILGIAQCIYPVRLENLPSISLVSRFSNIYKVADGVRRYMIEIHAASQLEAARKLLETRGSCYVKRPSIRGFYAFYSASESYEAYNMLEDAVYSGVGFFVRGLFGEIWKARDFDRIAASYVRDDAAADADITESDLLLTSPPIGEDCSACMPVRYRSVQKEAVVGVRAPLGILSIQNDDGLTSTPPLAVNKIRNRFGTRIEHGKGDMICCQMLDDEIFESAESDNDCGVLSRRLDLEHLFVVNGLIFEKTYAPA